MVLNSDMENDEVFNANLASIWSNPPKEDQLILHEIIPDLYLAPHKPDCSLPSNIKLVINLYENPWSNESTCWEDTKHEYKKIPLSDEKDITVHLKEILISIEFALKEFPEWCYDKKSEKVAIVYGERVAEPSFAVVVAYLCHINSTKSAEALRFLQTKKPDARVSDKYLKQIDEFLTREDKREEENRAESIVPAGLPVDLFEILPNLYLSRFPDLGALPEDITYVLNMGKECHPSFDPSNNTTPYRQIEHLPLDDIDDIADHIPNIIQCIDHAIKGPEDDWCRTQPKQEKILVHGHLGLDGSAAAIVAYLCHVYKIDSPEALAILKSKKADIRPSALFLAQIDRYFGRGKEEEEDDLLVSFHEEMAERKIGGRGFKEEAGARTIEVHEVEVVRSEVENNAMRHWEDDLDESCF